MSQQLNANLNVVKDIMDYLQKSANDGQRQSIQPAATGEDLYQRYYRKYLRLCNEEIRSRKQLQRLF